MPVLTFLSDYGLLDEFVGVCHGVVARIAPEVRVIDVTHGIARHDVRTGALVLRGALPYMPAGVHLAVVDPEVGGGPAPPAPPRAGGPPPPPRAPHRPPPPPPRRLRGGGGGPAHPPPPPPPPTPPPPPP